MESSPADFLTKKVPQFEQYLKTQFDEAYDKNNIRLSKKLADKKEKCEFNELTSSREMTREAEGALEGAGDWWRQ